MTTHGGIGQDPPRQPDPGRGDFAPSSQAPMTSPGFFDRVRRQGIRRSRKRWLGGVASGTAIRMGVPVPAVRAAFVVLALFSGLGLFTYGLAWALLPEDDGRIHAEDVVARGHWSAGMTGAAVMTLIGLSGTYLSPVAGQWDYWWFFWPLAWLAAVAAVVYVIITQGRAETLSPSSPRPAHPQAPARAHAPARQHSWDGPGTPFVTVIIGTAVIVAGITLFLAAAGALDFGHRAGAAALAAAATVLAMGIIVAGLAGRNSGILGFLAVAALVSSALTGVFNAPENVAVGRTFSWAPESTGQLMDSYGIAAGSGELDLRLLAAAAPVPADITLAINAAASSITVLLPEGIPVRINSRMAFSTIQYNDGGTTTGIWNPEEHTYSKDAPGGVLVLDLQGAFSTVSITAPS